MARSRAALDLRHDTYITYVKDVAVRIGVKNQWYPCRGSPRSINITRIAAFLPEYCKICPMVERGPSSENSDRVRKFSEDSHGYLEADI